METFGVYYLIAARRRTICDLRPSGRVEVEGKVREAVAREGFIARGARVRVAGTDGFRVVVVKAE